jgi:phosphoribosylformylglycinamidine synthase I
VNTAVVSFPGTNCDHDISVLVKALSGHEPIRVWATDRSLPKNLDLLFIPGGFSYGDYLRCGAMAKVSSIAPAIIDYAERGGNVVGICNGFQILCELGLLPGVLLPNRSTKFLSRIISMQVASHDSVVTSQLSPKEVFHVPVAHFEGNYFASEEALKEIEDNNQVIFRYCSPEGLIDEASTEWNPNGSCNAIAGVRNASGNVVGYMPHPERIFEPEIDPSRTGAAVRLFQGLFR